MLGDITPPRSFTHPTPNNNDGAGGDSSNSPLGAGAYGGVGSAGLGGQGMGLGAGSGSGDGVGGVAGMAGLGDGRRNELRQSPGMLSVILGLPFRLVGKVRGEWGSGIFI